MTTALVCAYSEVGVRCLRVLLQQGIKVSWVLTHEDDPAEQRWFGSVAELAREHGLRVATPTSPGDPEWLARLGDPRPDFLFSFYYRYLLPDALLALPLRGALNMHGSLLPKYRGRVPVNWALVHGETQTGATLHYMLAKPDAGPVVGREAVAIGINETALEVSQKVAAAAERLLARCLPALVAGTAPREPLDLAAGSYYGRRRPEDGRIDWAWPAARIHNLVRAVAPPFPGAFAALGGHELRVLGSRNDSQPARHPDRAPCLYAEGDALLLDCADGRRLTVTRAELAGQALSAANLASCCGAAVVPILTESKELTT
jgi:methionyl-tRNA formyltransferase